MQCEESPSQGFVKLQSGSGVTPHFINWAALKGFLNQKQHIAFMYLMNLILHGVLLTPRYVSCVRLQTPTTRGVCKIFFSINSRRAKIRLESHKLME